MYPCTNADCQGFSCSVFYRWNQLLGLIFCYFNDVLTPLFLISLICFHIHLPFYFLCIGPEVDRILMGIVVITCIHSIEETEAEGL